jgi:cobalamin 5'-phosphate synthase/cobalamin synthase
LIADFLAAITFLTRLPVDPDWWGRRFRLPSGRKAASGGWAGETACPTNAFGAKQVARSQRWFPLVGAMLGGIYAGVLWIVSPHLPLLVSAVLVVALDAWLTGAMHLDGLADTADGFGGGTTREDVLRIMRDHAIGSYGAVAVALALALKMAAVTALIGSSQMIAAMVLAPALGRWSAVLLSATQPYARPVSDDHPKAVGAPTRYVGRLEAAIATLLVLIAAPLCDFRRGPLACALVAFVSVLWAWRCRSRIGGITGDTLGAVIVASECLVLLVFVVAV